MTARRKIAVFTGNRAEYSLQYPILKAVDADPRLDYFLLAGGTHVDPDFGRTVAEVEADGFTVHREVDMPMRHDSLLATTHLIGSGILSLAGILEELRPDFLVVSADRSEAFAAMITGTQMGFPTAHVEGGDYTEGGALDDSVRHAMTKLAHLHFATNEQAAERIRRLGEEPWRVHTVGLPALDMIAAGLYAPVDEVRVDLALDLNRPIVLFCQHSVTTEYEAARTQVRPALEALRRLARDGYQVVITFPNNDAGGRQIVEELESMRGVDGVQIHKSLGRRLFHGLLNAIGSQGHGALVGNSSAGIKETPAFGCPAVNIGTRQQGRLRGSNVLDVPYDADLIGAAIRQCVDDDRFRAICRTAVNPYGAGDAGPRIAEVLATIPIDASLLQKKMTY
jgi:UDP-N-acetylglucosamine 2-epimerase (non-hydrolysing)/GDP/UDP-N,N'-diacetylbacillosamine 2-epimerase (hydrolysing)